MAVKPRFKGKPYNQHIDLKNVGPVTQVVHSLEMRAYSQEILAKTANFWAEEAWKVGDSLAEERDEALYYGAEIANRMKAAAERARYKNTEAARQFDYVITHCYKGTCPICGEIPSRMEYDHFFESMRNDPEHGWKICAACHKKLSPQGSFEWTRWKVLDAMMGFQKRRKEIFDDPLGLESETLRVIKDNDN